MFSPDTDTRLLIAAERAKELRRHYLAAQPVEGGGGPAPAASSLRPRNRRLARLRRDLTGRRVPAFRG